jgi:hypothetical protein
MNRWSHWYPHTIAACALLAGCSLYLFARPASLFYAGGDLATPLLGQLPSFMHTLALALACSIIATRQKYTAILSWGTLELLAEYAQHDLFPVPHWLGAYQQSSTFDPLDLLSILAAIAVAMFVTHTTRYSLR